MSDAIERSNARPIAFAGGLLDRVDQVRIDPERLADIWADPRARIVVLDGLDPVPAEGGMLETMAVTADARLVDHALLGIRPDGSPLFVSLLPSPPTEREPVFPPRVWQIAALLQAEELAIYGGARSLADWHQRHRFCAKCGQSTAPIKAGWARQCGACATEHFPRTDPVVIMLAEYRGKVLVGRNGRFPPRRFSALAGFVEPGETIEEAVRRELFEEAGIRVGRVDYLMSQPWPFPSQLMIACMAQAEDDALTLDTAEIAEAIWVNRADVAKALAEEEEALFLPPSSIAVARHMLELWLERG
ncbi:MAG: NAD(+) diphosphatase [Sphingobium sp.]|nr:NAD(+) diphosphatase [Sphingobium sp.]